MTKINSLVHDHCSRNSGYLVQWNDTEARICGWTWHRTFAGALKSQSINGGEVYRITSNDSTVKVA